MTAINDHEFLVIERDGTSGDPGGFKIGIDQLDAGSFATKTEVVDLMNLADPNSRSPQCRSRRPTPCFSQDWARWVGPDGAAADPLGPWPDDEWRLPAAGKPRQASSASGPDVPLGAGNSHCPWLPEDVRQVPRATACQPSSPNFNVSSR